jgi:YcaO-like protein with predicted kinase domain
MSAALFGPSAFTETPIRSASGHARSLEETWAWIQPICSKVPITRIVNVSPLDFLGMPVWSAVTPHAKDLTVHAGKGTCALASRLSAVMEAIERVCAEESAAPIVRGSYQGLSEQAAENPADFNLPFASAYRPDRDFDWLLAYDISNRRQVLLPLDLVISPPREGLCVGVETNGLASGNTYTEATLHALYELIERHALACADFCDQLSTPGDPRADSVRMLDPNTLPAGPLAWVQRLQGHGLLLHLRELTNDLRVPVFGAVVVDRAFPGADGPVSFAGYGADLNPERAVFRAISEAVQAHTIVMLGARDTFEGLRPIPDRAAMLTRRLSMFHPSELHAFDPTSASSQDLLYDLETVLTRLRDAGASRCIVADLTREQLGVPVVRVLVPGLASPFGASSRRPPLGLLRKLVP